MTQTLSDYHHHVLPGDVLLLKSTGFSALGNRFGQRTLRLLRPLRTARFTHVAVVVSQTHIADAIPKKGVQIRSWQDAAAAYDLKRCVVARHPDLLAMAHDPARLMARVQYYYAQRYWLTSLARRNVRHDKGVVCSQFVSLVMQDLGVPLFAGTAMRALPSDVDHGTRGKSGWRQFPFSEYGWHPSVSAPAWNDEYWNVFHESLPRMADLDNGEDDDKDNGNETDERSTSISETPDAHDPAEPLLSLPELSRRISEKMGHRMAESMHTVEAVLRLIAEVDRKVLALDEAVDALDAGRVRHGCASDPVRDFLDDLPSPAMSGASLLEHWHRLYVKNRAQAPKVLADADAPQRLARYRLSLGKNLKRMTQAVSVANGRAEALQAQLAEMADIAQQGDHTVLDLIAPVQQDAASLLEQMVWLADESPDAITARCAGYVPLLNDTLKPLLPALGADVGAQALDQLIDLLELDQQCYDWAILSKPTLLVLRDSL